MRMRVSLFSVCLNRTTTISQQECANLPRYESWIYLNTQATKNEVTDRFFSIPAAPTPTLTLHIKSGSTAHHHPGSTTTPSRREEEQPVLVYPNHHHHHPHGERVASFSVFASLHPPPRLHDKNEALSFLSLWIRRHHCALSSPDPPPPPPSTLTTGMCCSFSSLWLHYHHHNRTRTSLMVLVFVLSGFTPT